MNKLIKRDKGFTIIEVVLVLAIAALIFLMVFVALPALQRSQRDTARKADASIVAAAVQDYMSAERAAPTVAKAADIKKYVTKLGQYETSSITVEAFPTGGAPTVTADQIKVIVASKCDGTKVQTGVARSAAVVVKLEGGAASNYCVDV